LSVITVPSVHGTWTLLHVQPDGRTDDILWHNLALFMGK